MEKSRGSIGGGSVRLAAMLPVSFAEVSMVLFVRRSYEMLPFESPCYLLYKSLCDA